MSLYRVTVKRGGRRTAIELPLIDQAIAMSGGNCRHRSRSLRIVE